MPNFDSVLRGSELIGEDEICALLLLLLLLLMAKSCDALRLFVVGIFG